MTGRGTASLTSTAASPSARATPYKRAGYLVDLNFIRISPWIWSTGGDYFNADQTRCTINQAGALEAMLWLYDLSAKQQVGPFAGAAGPGHPLVPRADRLHPDPAPDLHGRLARPPTPPLSSTW